MKTNTRIQYKAYLAAIARANGIADAAEKFAATPTTQQKLEDKIQLSSDFLKLINIAGVDEMTGEKVGIGVTGSIAGRTDTTQKDRETKDVLGLDSSTYRLYKTDFDTHIRYVTLDSWSKFPDFQIRLQNQTNNQIALDRIKIGFYGKSAATNTDIKTNPNLEDVNIGWLEQYRKNAPERVLNEIKPGSKTIKVGESVAADEGYKNLAALVFDAINDLIHPAFQSDPRIRVFLSAELRNAYLLGFINRKQEPTEQNAAAEIVRKSMVGLSESIVPPYMPAGTILITMPENLSIYWQNGSMRRQIVDNAKRDRIEEFRSQNEGYVVEHYEAGCVIENIVLVD